MRLTPLITGLLFLTFLSIPVFSSSISIDPKLKENCVSGSADSTNYVLRGSNWVEVSASDFEKRGWQDAGKVWRGASGAILAELEVPDSPDAQDWVRTTDFCYRADAHLSEIKTVVMTEWGWKKTESRRYATDHSIQSRALSYTSTKTGAEIPQPYLESGDIPELVVYWTSADLPMAGLLKLKSSH